MWQSVGPSLEWIPVRRWSWDSKADATAFGATSQTVTIGDYITPGRTVKVVYATDPVPFTTNADVFTTQTGLPESCKDLDNDGDIDSDDYLKARDIAIKKAMGKKDLKEDIKYPLIALEDLVTELKKQGISKAQIIDIVNLTYGGERLKEGDHEVAMAQSSLKDIAKSAIELSQKMGGVERNIPGWIQDHISKAENYIEQAAQGFHELKGDE